MDLGHAQQFPKSQKFPNRRKSFLDLGKSQRPPFPLQIPILPMEPLVFHHLPPFPALCFLKTSQKLPKNFPNSSFPMGMDPAASPENARPPPGHFPAPSRSPHSRILDPSPLQRENLSQGCSARPFSPSFPLIFWEIGSSQGQQDKELHSWFIFLPFLRMLGIDGLTTWQIPTFPQHHSLFDTGTSQNPPYPLRIPFFFNHSSHQVGKQPR